jgi:hypothetical protein
MNFNRQFPSRADSAACVALILIAAALYLVPFVHASALWRDEVDVLNVARLPGEELLRKLEFESFPIGWFLVLKGWIGAGLDGSARALRVLGLLVGMVLIGVCFLMARGVGNRGPAVLLLLLVTNEEVIRYGSTIRAYGMGMVFAVFCFYCYWRLVLRPDLSRWILAAVSAALAVHTLFHNAVLVFAVSLAASAAFLSQRERRRAVGVLILSGGIGLSLLFYLPMIQAAGEWRYLLFRELSLSWLWGRLIWTLNGSAEGMVWLWLGVLAAAVASGAITLRQDSSRQLRLRAVYGLTVIAVALATYPAFLFLVGYDPQPWYFFIGLVLLAASAEILLPSGTRLRRYAIVAGVIALAIRLPVQVAELQRPLTNVHLIAERLEEDAAPGDLILVHPWMVGISFDHYFEGDVDWTSVPPVEDHSVHRYDLAAQNELEKRELVTMRMEAVLSRGQQLWIVTTASEAGAARSDQILPPPDDPTLERGGGALLLRVIRSFGAEVECAPVGIAVRYENMVLCRAALPEAAPAAEGNFATAAPV